MENEEERKARVRANFQEAREAIEALYKQVSLRPEDFGAVSEGMLKAGAAAYNDTDLDDDGEFVAWKIYTAMERAKEDAAPSTELPAGAHWATSPDGEYKTIVTDKMVEAAWEYLEQRFNIDPYYDFIMLAIPAAFARMCQVRDEGL